MMSQSTPAVRNGDPGIWPFLRFNYSITPLEGIQKSLRIGVILTRDGPRPSDAVVLLSLPCNP